MAKASVREKIGIETIEDDGSLRYTNGAKTVFFEVAPSNLSVLSALNVRSKIIDLASLAKIMGAMDMYALDDRENYSENRRFIRQRIDEEVNPAIRRILEEDERYIKTIEADSSSARLFLVSFYIPKNIEAKMDTQLQNFRKLAAQSQLQMNRVGKEQLKKIYAVYFKHDTTSTSFPDLDGMSYYDDVDWDEIRYRAENPIEQDAGGISIDI